MPRREKSRQCSRRGCFNGRAPNSATLRVGRSTGLGYREPPRIHPGGCRHPTETARCRLRLGGRTRRFCARRTAFHPRRRSCRRRQRCPSTHYRPRFRTRPRSRKFTRDRGFALANLILDRLAFHGTFNPHDPFRTGQSSGSTTRSAFGCTWNRTRSQR